jgi:hypothetical protein
LIYGAELRHGAARQTLQNLLASRVGETRERSRPGGDAGDEERVLENRQEDPERLPLRWIDPVEPLRYAGAYPEVAGGHTEQDRVLVPFESERGEECVRQGVERLCLAVGQVHSFPRRLHGLQAA